MCPRGHASSGGAVTTHTSCPLPDSKTVLLLIVSDPRPLLVKPQPFIPQLSVPFQTSFIPSPATLKYIALSACSTASCSSCEHYPAIVMAVLGLQYETTCNGNGNTYVDWNIDIKYGHPRTFKNKDVNDTLVVVARTNSYCTLQDTEVRKGAWLLLQSKREERSRAGLEAWSKGTTGSA